MLLYYVTVFMLKKINYIITILIISSLPINIYAQKSFKEKNNLFQLSKELSKKKNHIINSYLMII